jgi:chromosome segregation protein
VELLDEEVKRLKNAPSQSSSLLKTFRSSVSQLNPRWELPGDESTLSPKERKSIADVLDAATRALTSVSETSMPVAMPGHRTNPYHWCQNISHKKVS